MVSEQSAIANPRCFLTFEYREEAQISSYVGCDIAEKSVHQAAERYNKDRGTSTFRPSFLVGDMFKETIADFLNESHMFDVVSCQFAMHYAFESEERVRHLLKNVTDRLKPGGFFIGTTTDANVLVRKLRATDGLEITNGVYRIVFDQKFENKRFAKSKPFGIRYTFTLDDKVVDCPEFLVHFPTFEKLARQFDLELVLLCNFHNFFVEFSSNQYPEYQQLMFNMRVIDDEGTIPVQQWDAIYLYTAFAFRKIGEPSLGDPENVVPMARKRIDPSEIVVMANANGTS